MVTAEPLISYSKISNIAPSQKIPPPDEFT